MNSYSIAELQGLKVRINLLRLIDENGILKNQINKHAMDQIYFTLKLISHSREKSPEKYTKVLYKKLSFEEVVLFQWFYQDLSSDAIIAISIWSSAKQYNPKEPLGSTVIPIFDQRLCLRQGKYHLYVWPKVLPDITLPSQTPGLIDDPNTATINFISDKLEQQGNQLQNKTQEALKLKLWYTYRLIPAAFLEIQFPKFSAPVFYKDKVCTDFQQRNFISQNQATDFNDGVNIYDPDFQGGRLDPLQQTFFLLKRQNEGNPQDLIPSRQQMKIIDDIVSKSFKVDLRAQQKELFVKYRYYLSQERKYLLYYLNSVQWANSSDQLQGLKLLKKWQKIEREDALHILSRQFAANSIYNRKKFRPNGCMQVIRDYAVQIIAHQKDDDIISIILQLVQSIRYDALGQSSMVKFLSQKSLKNQQIATLFYWYLRTQSQQVKFTKQNSKNKDIIQQSVKIYADIFQQFKNTLTQDQPSLYDIIKQQQKFLTLLRKISKGIKQIKQSNDKKKAQLRKKLQQVDWQSFGQTPFPMNMKFKLKCPITPQCTIFSSAMAPMKLTFEVVSTINTTQGHLIPTSVNPGKYSFIYKNGDDLRQDQLILQMFALMDRLLKGINQDYKLTPYKTLACSKSDGFVQFVPETTTVQDVDLKNYLVKLIDKKQESTNLQMRNQNIMENFVFSSAGYSAITYFFGIGDRHLQNLLVDNHGKLFHIDFGFILGRDPKPYPPPIKICKQMVQAMGGSQHQNFKKFRFKCLEAYLYLRKYSKLIYYLVYLMIDSGIKDVHQQGMLKLYDKFSITMNDKQAQKHFLLVLQQCKNALFGQFADTIHRWATYFRD